jgi:hypothetical protein
MSEVTKSGRLARVRELDRDLALEPRETGHPSQVYSRHAAAAIARSTSYRPSAPAARRSPVGTVQTPHDSKAPRSSTGTPRSAKSTQEARARAGDARRPRTQSREG